MFYILNLMFKVFITILLILTLSCAEKVEIRTESQNHRPPGLIVASEKAVENGKKHLRKGHCGKAIHEFNKALAKNPNNFEALYWLGVAEGMCGYYPEAYNRLTIALKYVPDRTWEARVSASIGLILVFMEKEEEARIYFDRAKRIDPMNELVIQYSEGERIGKGKKGRAKIKKEESFGVILKWLD
ncbi:tetratricopeptide repeat protein [Thermocrinis sp.]